MTGFYKYVGKLHELEKREGRHYGLTVGEDTHAISVFLMLPIRSVSLASQ